MVKQKSSRILREFIDGTLLARETVVRQLPFMLFLIFLAFVYISNRYNAESLAMQKGILQREIKELRSESISISSDLMYMSKQSEVIKLINQNNLELQETVKPPKKIVIEKK